MTYFRNINTHKYMEQYIIPDTDLQTVTQVKYKTLIYRIILQKIINKENRAS